MEHDGFHRLLMPHLLDDPVAGVDGFDEERDAVVELAGSNGGCDRLGAGDRSVGRGVFGGMAVLVLPM